MTFIFFDRDLTTLRKLFPKITDLGWKIVIASINQYQTRRGMGYIQVIETDQELCLTFRDEIDSATEETFVYTLDNGEYQLVLTEIL